MRLLILELKRMLKSRLTLVLLLAALLLTVLSAYLPITFCHIRYLDEAGNEITLNGLDAIAYEKDVQSDITGTVTPEKVKQAVLTYQECLRRYGAENTYDLPEGVFGREILPYYPLLRGVREAFADPNTGLAPSLMELDPERLDAYYEACEQHLADLMRMEQKTHPAAQEKAMELYKAVSKPFQFFPGYNTDAMDYQILLTFCLLLFSAILTAPVFTSDYQTGADDIQRCTKYGRARFAATKIASALMICTVVFLICAGAYVLISDSLFGWECVQTSMQMLYSIVNLPNWTIGQLQGFNIVLGLTSLLATVSFTLFLSSRCKSMVAALSAALGFCVLPLVVYMALPEGLSVWLNGLLPASGAGLQTSGLYAAVEFDFWNLGDFALWLPHAMLGAYIVEIPLFAVLTVRSYTTHQ